MNTSPIPDRFVANARSALIAVVCLACRAVRRPLVALLTLFEPVVRAVFSLAMILGIISALVFELSAIGPHFPFLGMLVLALGFGLALFVYYGLLSLISR